MPSTIRKWCCMGSVRGASEKNNHQWTRMNAHGGFTWNVCAGGLSGIEEGGPARADELGRFFVGHVGKVRVGFIGGIGEGAGEALAGAFDEEGVFQAPGDQDGLLDFAQAWDVERDGHVARPGWEAAHDAHQAVAVGGMAHGADVAVAEFGGETGLVDVADVLDAADEFFGGGDGHEGFADEGETGEAVHFGKILGEASGVGEAKLFETRGFEQGGKETQAAAQAVAGGRDFVESQEVDDAPEGVGVELGVARVVGGGLCQAEGGVVGQDEVMCGKEVVSDAPEGGDGQAHAVDEQECGARCGG